MDSDSIKKVLEIGQRDLVNFRSVLLTSDEDVESPIFHYEWSDLLLNEKNNVVIVGYRESGKDQIVARAFPLYALTFPSKKSDYIVLIRNNDTQAQRTMEQIQNEAVTHPIISKCIQKIIKKTANIFHVETLDGEVRIESYGKGSSIRGLTYMGKRPRVVILNDIQDIEDASSETVLEKDWDWFLSDVKFLGKYSRIFMIGNNLGANSVIERVYDGHEQLGFDRYRQPVIVDGEPAWKARDTVESIEKEREEYNSLGKLDIWLREKMCVTSDDATRLFREEDYLYYTPSLADKLASDCNVFAMLDPASSPKNTSCFRSIAVIGVTHDNHWYVLDCPYGRWDSEETINQMFNVVLKWHPLEFGIEKGMWKQLMEPFVYKEMTKRNVRFNIREIEHAKAGSKLQRIAMLQPLFRGKTIWFPDNSTWLGELKAELAGVTRTEIKSAYADLMDSLAMGMQLARPPGNPRFNHVGKEPKLALMGKPRGKR